MILTSKDILYIEENGKTYKYLSKLLDKANQYDLSLGFNQYIGKRYPEGPTENGEDGVISQIFEEIGTTNKFCVEVGAGDGVKYSTTYDLRERLGFQALLIDGFVPVQKGKTSADASEEDIEQATLNSNEQTKFVKAFITKDNINAVFKDNNVPKEFDFLSLDIDGNDWWVWKELKYQPRVVMVEYNQYIPGNIDGVITYQDDFVITVRDAYNNASIKAFYLLGLKKGYTLVNSFSCNLFFIKNSELDKIKTINPYQGNVDLLYLISAYYKDEKNKPTFKSLKKHLHINEKYLEDTRTWTSAEFVLNEEKT